MRAYPAHHDEGRRALSGPRGEGQFDENNHESIEGHECSVDGFVEATDSGDLQSPGAAELPEDEGDQEGCAHGPDVVGACFHFPQGGSPMSLGFVGAFDGGNAEEDDHAKSGRGQGIDHEEQEERSVLP